jgi:hypothetical protein
MRTPARTLLALAICLATSACAVIDLEFQQLPAEELFLQVQPGETTRADVLRLLGPPDEFRRPGAAEWPRRSSPWDYKILEGGDVFGRDVYTYARERRRDTRFGILPTTLTIFRVKTVRSLEERWRIDFDQEGVVRSVSHVDEGLGK